MELFCKIITVASLAQVAFAVVVTLEEGKTGTVEKRVKNGSELLLVCNARPTSESSPSVQEWTYAKNPTASGTHIWHSTLLNDSKNERMSIKKPYSLQISHLMPSDTGCYQCRVTMYKDNPSVGVGKYDLTVLVPPNPVISCGFPSDLKLTLGQEAEFRCREQEEQAVPAATYNWYKNGTLLSPLSKSANGSYWYYKGIGILGISSVVAEDAGEYQCEAVNEVGSESCIANITIAHDDAIRRTASIQTIGILLLLARLYF